MHNAYQRYQRLWVRPLINKTSFSAARPPGSQVFELVYVLVFVLKKYSASLNTQATILFILFWCNVLFVGSIPIKLLASELKFIKRCNPAVKVFLHNTKGISHTLKDKRQKHYPLSSNFHTVWKLGELEILSYLYYLKLFETIKKKKTTLPKASETTLDPTSHGQAFFFCKVSHVSF